MNKLTLDTTALDLESFPAPGETDPQTPQWTNPAETCTSAVTGCGAFYDNP